MGNIITVTLESGESIDVKQLGLFELDVLMPSPLGPFTYKLDIFGTEHEIEYDIGRYEKLNLPLPQKPEKSPSTIREGTKEFDELMDWQLYQAALLHNKRRIESMQRFYEEVKNYILNNACIKGDTNLIVTLEDWRRVYDAALVPQLTIELIAKTLQQTYAAKFNNMDIMEALKHTKKGRGSYDVIKLWENKLMIQMQKTEFEYAMLPLEERARKVCAMFLDDIMSYLELDYEAKLRESDSKTKKEP